MDEKKLKQAFSKVKTDFDLLDLEVSQIKTHLGKLSQGISISSDIQKQIKKLENVDLETFVLNLESEFKSIHTLMTDFNQRFNQTSKFIEKFSNEMEKYNSELADLKAKLNKTQNSTANTKLDVNILNEKFTELQELLSEKVDLELGSLRLEFTEELAKVYDRIYTEVESKSQTQKPSLDKQKKIKKSKNSNKLNEGAYTIGEEGKFKKAMKWLFIDEENEDMDSIKGEIKNNKKQ